MKAWPRLVVLAFGLAVATVGFVWTPTAVAQPGTQVGTQAPTPPPMQQGMQPALPPGHGTPRGPVHATIRAEGVEGDPRDPRTSHLSAAPVEHPEEEEATPKPVNWADTSDKEQPPYVAALVNFLILLGLYVYFGRKPIAAALKARREEVKRQIEEAQKIKREAEARSKEYATKLGALEQELATTRATLASAGATERARIIREAEERAERMKKDALFTLEQERREVRMTLQREVVLAAVAQAEAMLEKALTGADHERLAEEFLSTLVPEPSQAVRARETSGASSGGAS